MERATSVAVFLGLVKRANPAVVAFSLRSMSRPQVAARLAIERFYRAPMETKDYQQAVEVLTLLAAAGVDFSRFGAKTMERLRAAGCVMETCRERRLSP